MCLMGGDNLVAPVQRLTDFMAGTVQGSVRGPISSSYRNVVLAKPLLIAAPYVRPPIGYATRKNAQDNVYDSRITLTSLPSKLLSH